MTNEEMKAYLNSTEQIANNPRMDNGVSTRIQQANKNRPMTADQTRDMIADFKAKAQAMKK